MHKVALQGEKWAREVDTVCNKIGKDVHFWQEASKLVPEVFRAG